MSNHIAPVNLRPQSPVVITDNEHIWTSMQAGDRKTFEMIFRTYYSPLCNFAFGFVADRTEAEEVVQQTFVQFWEKREQIGIEASMKSYLYRAVRNACLNRLKHDKVKRNHAQFTLGQPLASDDHVANAVDAGELQLRISAALNKLPEQCRMVFQLSRFEDLKYAEIAEKLGISIKTVENHMGKALRIMREELKEYMPLLLFFLYYDKF